MESNNNSSQGAKERKSIYSIQGENLIEIRPGRKIAVYSSQSSNGTSSSSASSSNDSNDETVLLFVHGSMGNFSQYRYQIAHFGGKGDVVFGKDNAKVIDEDEGILKANVERDLSNTKNIVDRLVAFDYLGCGKSEKPKTGRELYDTNELYQDLKEVFTKLILQNGSNDSAKKKKKNIFLVGHSFGTSMVLRLAEEFQDQISGCILVAAATMEKDGGSPIFMLPEFFLRWIQPFLSKGFIQKAHHPKTLHIDGSRFHKDLIERAYQLSGSNDMFVVKSFYTQMKWTRKDILEKLTKVPCLFIHGDEDNLIPLEVAKTVMNWLGNRDLAKLEVISDGGHQVMEERPDEVNRLIEDFIQAIKSKTFAKSLSKL